MSDLFTGDYKAALRRLLETRSHAHPRRTRPRMKRTIGFLALATLLLSGCGEQGVEQTGSDTATAPEDAVTVVLSESKVSGDDFDLVARKLPDGRWVTCVVYSGFKRGGVDCDWDGASTERPSGG